MPRKGTRATTFARRAAAAGAIATVAAVGVAHAIERAPEATLRTSTFGLYEETRALLVQEVEPTSEVASLAHHDRPLPTVSIVANPNPVAVGMGGAVVSVAHIATPRVARQPK